MVGSLADDAAPCEATGQTSEFAGSMALPNPAFGASTRHPINVVDCTRSAPNLPRKSLTARLDLST